MTPLESVDVASAVTSNLNNLVVENANNFWMAASVDDNGGYFFPIVGLTAIAATILFLSPPLADE